MARIRVALCITDLDVGGAERCLQHLAAGLDRGRFDPVVYCLAPKPADPQASCVEPIETAGIPIHCLDAAGAHHFPRTLARLRRLLLAQPPQIFQSFLFHANFLGRLAAKRAGVAHILSGIRVAERQSRWHLRLERWTHHLAECHVCVSRSVADFSVREVGIPASRIVVIPNGIDAEAAAATEPADLTQFGIAPHRRTITFVGRLEAQKGVPWLLETAGAWLPRLPDCELLLVGEGRQRPGLEAQAEAHESAGRIHFAGWRPDVAEILAASDLLVLPSRWEGMPNVILQAMAQRKPVLATKAEGTLELLGEQAGPQTAAYGETQDFSEKLFALMTRPQLALELGRANQRRVAQEFSLSRMIRSYEELWEGLAEA